jgi:antagonist of KipI
MIEIINSGPGRPGDLAASIQDLGRPGFERFGVPDGGAADWFSAAVANRLVGNRRDAALVEFTGMGASLLFHQDATIALAGASISGVHSFEGDPVWQNHRVAARQMVGFRKLDPGVRVYLAVRGGIDVPIVLGSRSLCERGHFGGGFGRRLRHGDALPIGDLIEDAPRTRPWPLGHRPAPWGPWEVRLIAGPHSDAFPPDALDRLTAVAALVTPFIDRVGLRIETPGLHLQGKEILTTPVTAGSVQVTPSGELIALLVDHPTTGGYPVIGTVIRADLPLLAQARPGDTIRFRAVDEAEAARALRRLEDWLEDH